MIGPPIYLVCACSSGEEFVAAFRRYADKGGIFIPLAEPIPANKKGRFAITLIDGGVMIEGEAEVVASSKSPSPLYGRVGMTIRFVELDDPSKTTLADLDRARLLQKVVAPSVAPRLLQDTLPPGRRPVVPPVSGRIDAANALAESVAIGDLAQLKDLGPKAAGPKFVIPSIPSAPMPRAKTPSAFPIVAAREQGATPGERTRTPTQPPPPAGSTPIIPGPNAPPPRARTGGTVPPPGSKPFDTQPVAVVPPPKQDPNERRADRSASLPPLEALKVGSTQAVAVVPPPQWSTTAKNLFGDPESLDTDTLRAAPKAASREDESLDDLKPVPQAADAEPTSRPHVPLDIRRASPPTATLYAMSAAPEAAVPTLDLALADADPTEDRDAVVPPPPLPLELAPTVQATPVPMVTVTHALTPTTMTAAPAPPDDDPVAKPPAPAAAPVPAPPVTPSLADLVRSAAAAAKAKPRVDANPTLRGTSAPKPAPLNRQQLAALEVDEKTDLTSGPPIAPELRMTAVGVGVPPAHDTEMLSAQNAGDIDIDFGADDVEDENAKRTARRGAITPLDGSSPLHMPAVKPPATKPTIEEPTPSGNWTMTMDGAIEQLPTKPAAGAAVAKPKPTVQGDWTITPDQDAPSWIGAAPRPDTASGIAGAKPGKAKVIDAVTTPGVDVDSHEPKIQIDPSLVGGPPVSAVGGVIGGARPVGVGVAAAHGDETPLPLPNVPVGPPAAVMVEPMLPIAPPVVVAQSMMPSPQQPMAMSSTVIPTPYPVMQAPMPGAMQPMPFAPSSTGSTPQLPPMPVTGEHNGYYPSAEDSVRNAMPVRDVTMNVGGRKKRGRGGLVLGIFAAILVLGAGGFALWYFVLNKHPGATPAMQQPPPTTTGSAASAVVPAGSGSGSGSAAQPMVAVDGSGSAGTAPESGSGSGSGSAGMATVASSCIVDVVTNPAEVGIFDERNLQLGTSPAQVKVPCGSTRLILRKETYAETIRPVVATPDGTAKLRAALAHAGLSVKVSSTPAGATVSVGGKSKGVTPTTMQLPMLESSTIVFTKDGFQTESEKIVPRQPNQAVHVQLRRKGQRLK